MRKVKCSKNCSNDLSITTEYEADFSCLTEKEKAHYASVFCSCRPFTAEEQKEWERIDDVLADINKE